MTTSELSTSERLRVQLALAGKIHFELEGDKARRFIKAIEHWEKYQGREGYFIIESEKPLNRLEVLMVTLSLACGVGLIADWSIKLMWSAV